MLLSQVHKLHHQDVLISFEGLNLLHETSILTYLQGGTMDTCASPMAAVPGTARLRKSFAKVCRPACVAVHVSGADLNCTLPRSNESIAWLMIFGLALPTLNMLHQVWPVPLKVCICKLPPVRIGLFESLHVGSAWLSHHLVVETRLREHRGA